MPREYTSTNCPLCAFAPESGRLDHLVKHISKKHNDASVYPLVTEAGHSFEPVSPGSHIIFCGLQKVGCCLKCSHPIHVSGHCKDRRAFFTAHTCKPKQLRDYGKGPGAGRKGAPPVAAPAVQKVVETKTKTIIERIVTVPEDMEETLRNHPKIGYLFKKPEPTPKEDDDDWTDSEDEVEEAFGETLMRHLLSIPRYERALKKVTDDRTTEVNKLEAEIDALQMALRDAAKASAHDSVVIANYTTAVMEATTRSVELEKVIVAHVPEDVRKKSGLQISGGRLPHEV